MTRKIAVSLPDDVAARLDNEENVSAFVAEAVRRTMRAEQTTQLLTDAGIVVTDEGKERMRARLREADLSRAARRATA